MIIKSDSIKVFHSTICFDRLLQQIYFLIFYILSKESKSVTCVRTTRKGSSGQVLQFHLFLFGIKITLDVTGRDLLGNKSARRTNVK